MLTGVSDPKSTALPTVTLAGIRIEVTKATPQFVEALLPTSLSPGPATLEVQRDGKVSNRFEIEVMPSAPIVAAGANGLGVAQATHADGTPVTPERPAIAGSPIILPVAGLGSAHDGVRVLFDGTAGSAVSADAGQLRVTLPSSLSDRGTVAVAVATAEGFTDLAELPVARRNSTSR
jgi:hypothetical protein